MLSFADLPGLSIARSAKGQATNSIGGTTSETDASLDTRVLIVEDDSAMGELLLDYVRQWRPLAVDVVEDGDAGWTKILKTSYKLIILDWRLPKISGLVLFNRLRTLKPYEQTPVIISSGLLDRRDEALLGEYPCTVVVRKPFTSPTFREAVDSILRDWAWYQEHQAAIETCVAEFSSNRDSALTKLLTILKSGSRPMPVAVMAARSLRAQGDFVTAERLLNAVLKQEPASVVGLFELGKVLFETRRFVEAKTVLLKAQEFSPKNLNRARLLGETLLNLGEADAAAAQFAAAVAVDADDAKAAAGLSVANAVSSHAASDEASGPEEGRVTQSLASVINLIAISLVAQGKYAEGIQHYEQALEFLADRRVRGQLHFNIGLAYNKSGNLDKALEYFQQVPELCGPTFDKARRYLGLAGSQSVIIEGEEPTALAEPQPLATALIEDGEPRPIAPSPPEAPTSEPGAQAGGDALARALPPLIDPSVIKAATLEALAVLAQENERLAKNPEPLGRHRILVYHPEPNGWQRALRQLQLFGCTEAVGVSDRQVALSLLQSRPFSVFYVWFQASLATETVRLIEEVLEEMLPGRCGILVHCNGEKDYLSFLTAGRELLVDKVAVVNWNRERFLTDVTGVVNSAAAVDAPLSQLYALRPAAAQSAEGPAGSAAVREALTKAAASLPTPSGAVWFSALEVSRLMAAGQWEAAQATARGLLAKWPQSFTLRLLMAGIATQAGKESAGLELVGWALKAGKASAGRIARIAGLMLGHGRVESLGILLQGWAERQADLKGASFHGIAGRYYLEQKLYDKAARHLQAALLLEPLSGGLLLTYSACLSGLLDHRQGGDFAALGLRSQPSLGLPAQLQYARCLLADRQWSDAEAYLGKLLAERPEQAEALAMQEEAGRRGR